MKWSIETISRVLLTNTIIDHIILDFVVFPWILQIDTQWAERLLIWNFQSKNSKLASIYFQAFCDEMGINPYDIVSTLQYLGMIKYWKGQHIILKKEDIIDTYLEKSRNRPKGRQIYPGALKWKPYEPTARERKQAEQIKRNQEEKQKKR